MAQRPARRWDLLPPLVCKYCRHRCVTISRYLSHLRHHELWIQPYWYVKRPYTIDVWRNALRKKLFSSKRQQWDSTGQTDISSLDPSHSDTNNNAIYFRHQREEQQTEDHPTTGIIPLVKRHLCRYCGKGFRVENILRKHLDIHLDAWFAEESSWPSEAVGNLQSKSSRKLVFTDSTGTDTSDDETADELSSDELDFLFSDKQSTDWPYNDSLDKKYQCGYCDKTFQSENILINHMKIHMDEDTRRSVEIPDNDTGILFTPHERVLDDYSRKLSDNLGVVPVEQGTMKARAQVPLVQKTIKRRGSIQSGQPKSKVRCIQKEPKILHKRHDEGTNGRNPIRSESSPQKPINGSVEKHEGHAKPFVSDDDAHVAVAGNVQASLPVYEMDNARTAGTNHKSGNGMSHYKTLTKQSSASVTDISVLKEQEYLTQSMSKKLHPVHAKPRQSPNKQLFLESAHRSTASAVSLPMKRTINNHSLTKSNMVKFSTPKKSQVTANAVLPRLESHRLKNNKTETSKRTSHKPSPATADSWCESPKKLTSHVEFNTSKPKKLSKFSKSVHEESKASLSKTYLNKESEQVVNLQTSREQEMSCSESLNHTRVSTKQISQVDKKLDTSKSIKVKAGSFATDKKCTTGKTKKSSDQRRVAAKPSSQTKVAMENQKELKRRKEEEDTLDRKSACSNKVSSIDLQSHRKIEVDKTKQLSRKQQIHDKAQKSRTCRVKDDANKQQICNSESHTKHLQPQETQKFVNGSSEKDQQNVGNKTKKKSDNVSQNSPSKQPNYEPGIKIVPNPQEQSSGNTRVNHILKPTRKKSVSDNVPISKPSEKVKMTRNSSAEVPVNAKKLSVHLKCQGKSERDKVKLPTTKSHGHKIPSVLDLGKPEKPTKEVTSLLPKKKLIIQKADQLLETPTSEKKIQIPKKPTEKNQQFPKKQTVELTIALPKKLTPKKTIQLTRNPSAGNFQQSSNKPTQDKNNQSPRMPIVGMPIVEETSQAPKKSTKKTKQFPNKPTAAVNTSQSLRRPTTIKTNQVPKKTTSHEVRNTCAKSQSKVKSDKSSQMVGVVPIKTDRGKVDPINHASQVNASKFKNGKADVKVKVKDGQQKQTTSKQAASDDKMNLFEKSDNNSQKTGRTGIQDNTFRQPSQDHNDIGSGLSRHEKDQQKQQSVAKSSKAEAAMSVNSASDNGVSISAGNVESSSCGYDKTKTGSQSRIDARKVLTKDKTTSAAKTKINNVKVLKHCKKVLKYTNQELFKPDSKIRSPNLASKKPVNRSNSNKSEPVMKDRESLTHKSSSDHVTAVEAKRHKSSTSIKAAEHGQTECRGKDERETIQKYCKCNQRFKTKDAYHAHTKICTQKAETSEEHNQQSHRSGTAQAENKHSLSFGSKSNHDAKSPEKPSHKRKTSSSSLKNCEDISRQDSHRGETDKPCKEAASSPKNYECKTCGLILKHKHTFIKHTQSCVQPVDEDSRASSSESESENCTCQKCDQCHPKTAKGKSKLNTDGTIKQTRKRATGEYTCPLPDCKKVVMYTTSLFKHMDSHMEKSDRDHYDCGLCGKKFLEKRYLREHLLAHAGHRYTCGQCGQQFRHRISLIHHKRKGHQDVEYPCPHAGCGKVFKLSKSLFLHKQSHLRKIYKCENCYKSFTGQKSLDEHIEAKCHLQKHCSSKNCAHCHPEKKTEESKTVPNSGKAVERKRILKSGEVAGRKPVSKLGEAVENKSRKTTDSSSEFICSFPDCKKVLASKATLENHLLTHNSDREVYKCNLCDKKYVNRLSLQEHKIVKHNGHKFKCKECKKEFNHSAGLIVHMKRGHKPPPDGKPRYGEIDNFPCKHTDCGKIFKSRLALTHHKITAHMQKEIFNFKCEKCDKTFISQKSLTAHRDLHNDGQKPFRCGTCGMAFQHKATLHSHKYRFHRRTKGMQKDIAMYSIPAEFHNKIEIIKKDGALSYKCKLCSKIMPSLRKFKIHAHTVHMGKKIFRCRFCVKSFPTRGSCKFHEEIHTGVKHFKCRFCSKPFRTKGHCNDHEKTHTQEKNFSCHLCDYKCIVRATLKNHMRTHTKEQPFKCSYPDCKRAFSFQSNCIRHERIHTNIKPHKCEECGYAARSIGELKRHMNVHTDKKEHACKICGQKFKTRPGMLRHEKAHTGIKDHSCSDCQKKFYTRDELRSHQKYHSEDRPLPCRYCSMRFKSSANRYEHESIHLGIKKRSSGKGVRYFCTICDKYVPGGSHANIHVPSGSRRNRVSNDGNE